MGNKARTQMPVTPPSVVSSKMTIRSLAARLGLSVGTVSMALRDNPAVAEATRNKIRSLAEKSGYRPDPQLARLMYQVRRHRGATFQSTIAAITNFAKAEERPYQAALIGGARKRAEALGFALNVIRGPMEPGAGGRLQRTLAGRGVEGVLLLPSAGLPALEELLDWTRFCTVAATWRIRSPEFHSVTPHQFGNMLLLCAELERRGYRRIGLVIHADHDRGVHFGFTGAMARHQSFGTGARVEPLIYETPAPSGAKAWYRRAKPDVIIATDAQDCRVLAEGLGLAFGARVGFAVTTGAVAGELAGIDENPAEVGAAAVDLLAARLQRNELGLPLARTVTMIQGRWVEGRSVRAVA